MNFFGWLMFGVAIYLFHLSSVNRRQDEIEEYLAALKYWREVEQQRFTQQEVDVVALRALE